MSSSVSNEVLLAAIVELKEQVAKMAEALQSREDRRTYQANYYKKRKETKKQKAEELANARLPNTRGSHFNGLRKTNVPIKKWVDKMKQFGKEGRSVYNWITWLAWNWNQDVFVYNPLTRSGGYIHVYLGMSNDKPYRHKYCQRDVTGQLNIRTIKTKIQAETLAGALWWDYSFRTIGLVFNEVKNEEWFKQLDRSWETVIRIALGQYGFFELGDGWLWEETQTDINKLAKGYNKIRNYLEPAWRASLKGWFCKGEPFNPSKSP